MPQVFIHHNFRYGPEPPAYKTPKPEYPSYTRRETEKPTTHDRYIVKEKPIDDRVIDKLFRKLLKEAIESDELPDEEDRLESELSGNIDDLPNPKPRDLLKVAGILEQQPSKIEFQPIMDIGKRRQEPRERDPEQLLKELEAYPTEELCDKALAELNEESKFVEEGVEDSKVETHTLPSTELAPKGSTNTLSPLRGLSLNAQTSSLRYPQQTSRARSSLSNRPHQIPSTNSYHRLL